MIRFGYVSHRCHCIRHRPRCLVPSAITSSPLLVFCPFLVFTICLRLHSTSHRPWNYPLILTFQPLLGAVAAGCPAAIKLSEVVPQFSSLMAKLIAKYLDPRAYRVVLGGVKEITRVLQLKCTSSSPVGSFSPSICLQQCDRQPS